MRKKTDEQFKVEVRNLVGNEYSIEGSYEGSHTKIQFHHIQKFSFIIATVGILF